LVGSHLDAGLAKAQEITRIIEGLHRGDRVILVWHDACRVTNDPDVRPEYYSTPKETQGTVYDCVPDPDYPDIFYLIVSGETTGGRPDYYDAIPVAWIAKIEKLEVSATKHVKKSPKLVTEQYTVRREMKFRELDPHNHGLGEAPKKYVEEVVKVVDPHTEEDSE
jgi:hypothetical protein